jgi:hypothetical protein
LGTGADAAAAVSDAVGPASEMLADMFRFRVRLVICLFRNLRTY